MIGLFTMPLWLLFLLALLPLLLILKNKQVRRRNLPPGPGKLPIIGNLHQLGALPHRSLQQLSKQYGPIMHLVLGRMPTIVVSSAEIASEVFKSHDIDCCSRPDLSGPRRLSYNFSDIVFGPYSEYWREMRKLCVLELFSAKRVQSYKPIREACVASMINSISKSALTPVNLSETLYALTDEITCTVAFGKSYKGRGFDNGRFSEAVHDAMAMLGSFSATDFFPHVGWIVDRLTGLNRKCEEIFHEFDHFYQHLIDEHLKSKKNESDQEDIIDVLLSVKKDHTGAGGLTHDQIKGLLMNIFLGGVDTGAVTMEWAMTELAKNPAVMKKVQDEIRTAVGNKGKVDEADIDKLQFLKMVIKETFRLHIPVPLVIPREVINHFTIDGYDIHPKTRILVNAWAIGRDPKYWVEPEEFMPERFMNITVDYKGAHFTLLPFGAGRRMCPGMNMGLSNVELALANLLYAFDWGLPDGMKTEDINVEDQAGLLAHKKIPLYLIPIKKVMDP